MRFPVGLALCFLLLCSACSCSLGVGKVTVDPNHGGVASQVALESDARLAQKVTYEAKFTPVQQILADLTKITGVKLLAGAGSSDWPVRSRKMNIFVRDVQLCELMSSIAHTMKFAWSRGHGSNPPTYRLVVDRTATAAADAMLKQAEEAKEAVWRKRRERWLEVIKRDGSMSTQQIVAKRTSDPVFYRAARTGALRAMRAVFEEVPEAENRFVSGQGFRISSDKLTPNTQSLLYSSADEFAKFLQSGRGHTPAGLVDQLEPTAKFDVVNSRLDVESFTPNLRWSIYSVGSIGYFHIERDSKDWEISNLKDMDAPWIKAFSARESDIIDGLGTFGSTMPELERMAPGMDAYSNNEEETLYPSEPLVEHKAAAELDSKVTLKIDPPEPDANPVMANCDYIASFQKALAEATGMGVVSDSWVNIEGDKLTDTQASIADLLNGLAKHFNYNWDKSSAVLEFRHRKWWKNRLNQISDEQVTAWSQNTLKNGVLSLDDLAKISELNYYQAEESLKADKVVGQSGTYRQMLKVLDTNGNLRWLRLYASLSPEMRDLLMGQGGVTGKGGVNGHMLTAEQWKLAQTMFDRIGSTRSDALFYLRLLPSSIGNIIYQFREVDAESGAQDRLWAIALPKYTPSADQKSPQK